MPRGLTTPTRRRSPGVWLAPCWLAAAAAAAPGPLPPLNWKPVSDRREIRIFESEGPGTSIHGFRGVGIVHAPLLKVAHVIADPTRGTEWIDSLADSHVIRRLSATSFLEYDRMAMPPIIMRDRDFVSLVTLEADPDAGRIAIDFRSVDEPAAPPKRGIIRGDFLLTRFTLRALPDGATQVDALIVCDPKGWVPAWLVNWFQASWPRDTMEALRTQAGKPDVTDDPTLGPLWARGRTPLAAPAPSPSTSAPPPQGASSTLVHQP